MEIPDRNYYMGGLLFFLFRQAHLAKDPEERANYRKALHLADQAETTYEQMMAALRKQNMPVEDFEDDFLSELREIGQRRQQSQNEADSED